MLDEPRAVAGNAERNRLISSLRVLSNADVMQVQSVRGVLYVEDYTDINILRAWATQLGHRAETLLTTEAMVKHAVFQTRDREGWTTPASARVIISKPLQLVREGLPGVELLDGDAHPGHTGTRDYRSGPPAACAGGATKSRVTCCIRTRSSVLWKPWSAAEAARPHIEDMLAYWQDAFPPAVVRDPLGDHEFLNATKARTRLLPPLLEAAGVRRVPLTPAITRLGRQCSPGRFIRRLSEKLDGICRAFGVEP